MMTISRDELLRILDLVTHTAASEIDCDEVLEHVALYLDSTAGEIESPEFDALRLHLRACPECLEEVDAVVAAYRDPDAT